MQIAYARSKLSKSIFLAGPTPRNVPGQPIIPSWRPEALHELHAMGFDGTVFVPEDGDGSRKFEYDDQIEWELQALHSATVITFWVPREMEHMPALTTNIEFGLFAARRNVVLGAPPSAFRMKYLKGIAHMYGLQGPYDTLGGTLAAAIRLAERPFVTS